MSGQYYEPTSLFELAKHWLCACLSTHSAACGQSSHQAPTRLLALHGTSLKLIESLNLKSSLAYATLSHCWGTLEFLRLTQETLNSFKISIPFEDLPKTFQDAITITQQLGIGYLWIDSLCIIQDSPKDWKKEASLICE